MKYTYIPCNMKRNSCAVYTQNTVFPEEYLLRAFEFVENGANNGASLTELNTITFVDKPEYDWKLSDVYMAYAAYKAALEADFSFYIAKSGKDTPALFISKAFKGCRVLVNAFTFDGTIVQRSDLVARIAYMMDKSFPYRFCTNVYRTICDLEKGAVGYINAVICFRDTDDETLCVSPTTTLFSERVNYYSSGQINQFRDFLDQLDLEETEDFIKSNKRLKHKELSYWPELPMTHVKNIVETYDKCLTKKSNYIMLSDDNFEPYLYFSTNYRYLVHAETFECRIIKNDYLKSILINASKQQSCSVKDMNDWWDIAKG